MISNNDTLMEIIKTNLYEIFTNIKNSLSKIDLDKLTNGTDEEINSTSDINILINNLKTYINFILQEKNCDNENTNYNNNEESKTEIIRQLESYIRKLESDIKFHIRRQYQNKIFRDSLESKIRAYMQIEEDYEQLKEKVRFEDGKFLENDRKDNEINILRRENSNLKKEISKINKKYQQLNDLEEKNQQLEKIHINDEENIKNLSLKINQLNSKIVEMEEEINKTRNTYREEIPRHNNEILINDNNFQNINFSSTKMSLDKFNTKSTGNNSKKADNHIKQHFNIFNNDSKYIKSRTTKTMNNYKSLLKSNSYNQIQPIKNPITQIRNKVYKSGKKSKNNSMSMRVEDRETSELLNKYLKNKEYNSYAKRDKSQNLKRLEQNFSGYKFHISNNGAIKKYSKDSRNNKNIIYEHSALNILGIHGKYKQLK
jgi:hypothetical protein